MRRGWAHLVLWPVALVVLWPMILTVLYAFFPTAEISALLGSRGNFDAGEWMSAHITPSSASLRQFYAIMIEDPNVLLLYANSLFYASATLAGQALIIPMLSFALAKMRFRGREALSFFVVVLMILPFQVTMAPNVLTLRALGLLGSAWAVILPMCFAPFYIFLLRQYMTALPNELMEAAGMDGAGSVRMFLSIALPACKPVLGAALALSFADLWNMVEQPLLYLSDPARMPLSTMFNQLSEKNAEVVFAGAAIYILPAVFVYLYFQQDILEGIQLSELK